MEDPVLDSEDFLFDSLQTLYDYQPITLTTPGTPFTYTVKSACHHQTVGHQHLRECEEQPIAITLHTPDTDAANWALHASSIWVSSIYLADHISDLHLEEQIRSRQPGQDPIRILELGASAGLPSILIAKLYPEAMVMVTDYPDEILIKTLSDNVARNGVAQSCRALPFAWGSDPTALFNGTEGFDVVIAADTLWNPEFHTVFIDALKSTLRRTPDSRVYLVVGLHTGRYTIQSFLKNVLESGFELDSIVEKESAGHSTRNWEVLREEEDEKERRRWVIWIQLKCATSSIALQG